MIILISPYFYYCILMLNSVYFKENWSDRNVNFVLLKQMVIWQKFYSPYLSAIYPKPRLSAVFLVNDEECWKLNLRK